MFTDWKNTVKIATQPEKSTDFNIIPINIPKVFSTEVEPQQIPNIQSGLQQKKPKL